MSHFIGLWLQEADQSSEELCGQRWEADGPAAEGAEGSGVHLQIHRSLQDTVQSVRLYCANICISFITQVGP